LAPPNDQSERPHTLPQPEVNPLLNPLLAQNLGRWAEVYFTAPPEKREEAVKELLRVLEAENASGERSSTPESAVAYRSAENDPVGVNAQAGQSHSLRYCQACGHGNPSLHQFCGMCGAKLESDLPTARTVATDSLAHPDSAAGRADSAQDEPNGGRPRLDQGVTEPFPFFDRPAAGDPTTDLDDFALFRRVSARTPSGDEDWESEPSGSRRYGIYGGAVLAMLLLAFGYMAWHSSRQSSRQIPQPSPAASVGAAPVMTPSPAATPPKAQGTEEPARTPAMPTAGEIPATKGKDLGSDQTAGSKPVEQGVPQVSAPGSGGGLDLKQGGGNEELATAQRYLTGENGLGRDSAEAAKWLWKAVAKHNANATVVLADLYLKGDGVPKNCDQARVLLDSAARKGLAGAGERLRNLQAFGCQ